MKKLLILLIVMLPLITSVGCGDHPDWQVDVNVPYFDSETDLPAAHCVALWSNYHGPSTSESFIESVIGGSTPLSLMHSIQSAVASYTYSSGHLLNFPSSDAGQNEALSTIYASIDEDYPGIIPVFQDMHFLVTGANGSYVGMDQIAERVRFHSQSWNNRWEVVAVVKIWFEPIGSNYRVVVGSESFRDAGLQQYAQFVQNGGTYLGAPKNYQPELSHFPY